RMDSSVSPILRHRSETIGRWKDGLRDSETPSPAVPSLRALSRSSDGLHREPGRRARGANPGKSATSRSSPRLAWFTANEGSARGRCETLDRWSAEAKSFSPTIPQLPKERPCSDFSDDREIAQTSPGSGPRVIYA